MVVPTAFAGTGTDDSVTGPAAGEEFTTDPRPDPGMPPVDGATADAEGPSVLCHTAVYNDNSHNPSYRWSAHAHPNFYWGRTCGYGVLGYQVNSNWGSSFFTGSTSWHTSAPEGSRYIAVNTLFYEWHCHRYWSWGWKCSWHRHDFWGGWGTSPTVHLDLSKPDVAISGISAPKVVDGGKTFVTSDSAFSIGASDRYSGVRDVQTAFDGAFWKSGTSTKATGLADGAHTLNYRAIDNVGWVNEKAFGFILDNTPPAIDIIHPTYNSANVDKFSAEACTDSGNPRVLVGRETAAEVPIPEVPETPESPVSPPELPPLPPGVEIPEAPVVVTEGPDACGGEVVETADVVLNLPGLPSEVPPEVGEQAPTQAQVDAQDIDFTQPILVTGAVEFLADIQDATVGTRNVQFIVDGDVRDDQYAGNGEFAFTWDTTAERAGERVFTIRAFDRLGNVDEFSFTVIVAPQTQEGAAGTLAHAQGEGETAIADAQSDAEAEKAKLEAEADAAVADGCAAATPWDQFVPACRDE